MKKYIVPGEMQELCLSYCLNLSRNLPLFLLDFLQIFWSKSELEMIHQSTVYQETIEEKYQIEKDFLKIKAVSLFCFSPENL